MLIFYNIFQLLGLIVLAPIIVCVIIFKPKYRGRIFKRLGFGLANVLSQIDTSKQRIWIHALSVGEVSSVRSLVQSIRKEFPEAVIIFSSTTRSGEQHAQVTLSDFVDCFVSFPIDIYWVARFFITSVRPDLFVLVETDFWPNFLSVLKKKNIPAVLVNGRISEEAFVNYRRFRFLFQPMFQALRMLAVQREDDVTMLGAIGVPKEKVTRLGNLKYDVLTPSSSAESTQLSHRFSIPEKKMVWVAGSTHPGEEEILLNVCRKLQEMYPDLFLVIAPREINRAHSIKQLAEKKGIRMFFRTGEPVEGASGMILDTLGELAAVYSLADFAFVGGSLVSRRGHNPLEPAAKGKLVLFGPHMQDFIDIVTDMLDEKIVIQVSSEKNMESEIKEFLANHDVLESYGVKAAEFVRSRQGVTERHIELLRSIL